MKVLTEHLNKWHVYENNFYFYSLINSNENSDVSMPHRTFNKNVISKDLSSPETSSLSHVCESKKSTAVSKPINNRSQKGRIIFYKNSTEATANGNNTKCSDGCDQNDTRICCNSISRYSSTTQIPTTSRTFTVAPYYALKYAAPIIIDKAMDTN